MPLIPAPIPIRGAANNTPYIDQPFDACPVEGIRNIRPYGPDNRRRLASRPGIKKVFNQKIGNGQPIQGLGVITKASSISGYDIGSCVVEDGSSSVSGALSGQVWFFEPNVAMYADDYIDGSAYNGDTANQSVQHAAVAPTWSDYPDRVVVVSNFTDKTTQKVKYVLRIYDKDGNIIATTERSSPFNPVRNHAANSMAVSKNYIFVPTRRMVDVFKLSDGTLHSSMTLNNWASDVVACRIYKPTTGDPILYVLFKGTRGAGTYQGGIGGGVIEEGKWAAEFRAGVQKYRIASESDTVLTTYLEIFGQQKTSGDDYYEADHGYFRISEQSALAPHGATVTSMAVSPADGSIYITRCNRGWGPNNSISDFHPKDPLPFISLMKVSASGVVEWEIDTDSVREVGDGGYINDIPIGPGDDPTLLQAVCDADGNVFVAGRRNLFDYSILKVHKDGYMIWGETLTSSTLPSAHREGGIFIDPTDQGVITVADRNSDWTGATGYAHVWKLDNERGTVIWSNDLNEGVSGLGVCVLSDGRIVYTTDKV